jgi:hypothetical protein
MHSEEKANNSPSQTVEPVLQDIGPTQPIPSLMKQAQEDSENHNNSRILHGKPLVLVLLAMMLAVFLVGSKSFSPLEYNLSQACIRLL